VYLTFLFCIPAERAVSELKTFNLFGSSIYDKEPHEARPDVVEELKKQLREKDLVLTDIRLEALSSAHQLESLKDTVIKMRVSK
jgi:hypothetical protein